MVDDTLETTILQEMEQDSIQGRARRAPFDSTSAPGVGPGFADTILGGGLFMNVAQLADEIIPWSYYPMRRDFQLSRIWKTESIMSGALYSFSARISALPAKISGGKPRAKEQAQGLLHGLDAQKCVLDMLTTDNGFFIERVGPGRADKPLAANKVKQLAVISARQCWRTFDPEFPVIYVNPYTGWYHKLHYTRIITGSSCPQPDELARGIGFCAVSRAMRYMQIARDISIYKHEKIGGRFTRALGILTGFTAKTVSATLQDHRELEDAKGFTRYMGIPWLVSQTEDAKAQLINLASLPDGYNTREDTDIYVNALALAMGTDVREFWPGQGSGATKADATVQHEKARGKGIADVTSTIERALNWGVLEALDCTVEYDYTDDAEQMATAQYHFQEITNVTALQAAGNLSVAQGNALLISKGVIDPDVIESVAAAESSEPANTEMPYEQDTGAMSEQGTIPAAAGTPPAKAPAPPSQTTPMPKGGVPAPKPQPPQPAIKTSDMTIKKKQLTNWRPA